MTNYAFINSENLVVGLLIGPDDGLETFYQSMDIFKDLICVKVTNVEQDLNDGTFVNVGFTYDPVNNVYIAPPVSIPGPPAP